MLTAEAFVRSGKVRDLFELPDGRLLLIATDRISAFDVVLPTEIPDKGRVLTGLSRFWFAETDVDRPQPPARGRRRDHQGRLGGRHRRAADVDARPGRSTSRTSRRGAVG